jgi:hypothetical protein
VGLAGIGISGLAVAVVSTMALAPAFASDHHGDGSAAQDDAAEIDTGHGHGTAGTATGEAAEQVEGHTNAVISADGTSACEQAGVSNEGNSGHGHRGPVPYEPLDAETRATFASQVEQSNAVVAKYPTVSAAEAGGWRRITPYVPCIAAHYINSGLLDGTFDPAAPEILLFDGTDPDSQIVGLSYLVFTDPETPPPGFAGDNDPWHVHRQLCIGAGGVVGDENATKEECEQRGGRVIPLNNLWMMHMWNVAGWDSRWGLFSSEHPDLGGAVGDINAG